jgi:hypothetical protein
MLKKIFIALAAIAAVFLVVVSMQPSEFRVTRTASISAPAAAVFARVNDFIAKAVHLFMDMDTMVGGQFEKGLAQLESTLEVAPRQ